MDPITLQKIKKFFQESQIISCEIRAKNGEKKNICVDPASLEKYGLSFLDRVKTPLGAATVIGEADDFLWFLLDNDQGISYWSEVTGRRDLALKGIAKSFHAESSVHALLKKVYLEMSTLYSSNSNTFDAVSLDHQIEQLTTALNDSTLTENQNPTLASTYFNHSVGILFPISSQNNAKRKANERDSTEQYSRSFAFTPSPMQQD